MQRSAPTSPNPASAGHYHQRRPMWRSTTQRALAWPAILAALALLGLLLAFQQVVRAAVRQGEARHAATAAHSAAYWRCQGAQGRLTRESCQLALTASPHDDSTPQLRKVTSIETDEHVSR